MPKTLLQIAREMGSDWFLERRVEGTLKYDALLKLLTETHSSQLKDLSRSKNVGDYIVRKYKVFKYNEMLRDGAD